MTTLDHQLRAVGAGFFCPGPDPSFSVGTGVAKSARSQSSFDDLSCPDIHYGVGRWSTSQDGSWVLRPKVLNFWGQPFCFLKNYFW